MAGGNVDPGADAGTSEGGMAGCVSEETYRRGIGEEQRRDAVLKARACGTTCPTEKLRTRGNPISELEAEKLYEVGTGECGAQMGNAS